MPDTKWLLTNIQSPPLTKMLEDFLPTVPAKNNVNGKVLCPPNLLKILEKGVNLRNNILHGKPTKIKDVTIIELLNAVSDLLYLLNYFNGFTWAENQISPKTKEELLKSA